MKMSTLTKNDQELENVFQNQIKAKNGQNIMYLNKQFKLASETITNCIQILKELSFSVSCQESMKIDTTCESLSHHLWYIESMHAYPSEPPPPSPPPPSSPESPPPPPPSPACVETNHHEKCGTGCV